MKKLFLTIVIVAVSAMLFATNPISIEEAKLVSKNYLTQFSSQNQYETSDFTLVETKYAEDGTPAYYRFQIKGKGFIVISATNQLSPVLALSLGNDFASDEQTNYFANRFAHQAKMAKEIGASQSVANTWKNLSSVSFVPSNAKTFDGEQPLISTLWSQGQYYNMMCPIDNRDLTGEGAANVAYNDFRALVGCVAVSMANYLFYHQYPTVGVGRSSYVPREYSDEPPYDLLHEYERQDVDFSTFTYDYYGVPQGTSNNSYLGYGMVENYAGSMARILSHAGVSCFMGYGMSGSGAFSPDAYNALVRNWQMESQSKFFLLDVASEPNLRDEDSVKVKAFIDSICINLDNKMPVAFSGGVVHDPGGAADLQCILNHSFMIDGYYRLPGQPTMFHVNMGWGGAGNGYYQIYAGDLSATLNGYSCSEAVMLNIAPPDSLYQQDVIKPVTSIDTITASSGTIYDGSGAFTYKPGTNRTWIVEAPGATGYQVFFTKIKIAEGDELIIKNAAGNEVGSYSGNYLTAHVGDAPNGVFAGEELPASLTLTGSKFTVELIANDDDNVDYGFVLGFDAAITKPSYFCKPTATYGAHGFVSDKGAKAVNMGNGDTPEAVYAELSSNDVCPINKNCTYNVSVAWTTGLGLTFRKFDLQDGDVVELYTKENGRDKLEMAFTAQNPPTDIINLEGSTMKVKFISDNDNPGTGYVIEYFGIMGIEDQDGGIVESSLYPNPASNLVNVRVVTNETQDVTFQVTDIMGKVVAVENQSQVTGEYIHTMNVNNLANGMYIMNIITKKGKSTYKFVVE